MLAIVLYEFDHKYCNGFRYTARKPMPHVERHTLSTSNFASFVIIEKTCCNYETVYPIIRSRANLGKHTFIHSHSHETLIRIIITGVLSTGLVAPSS